MKSVVVGVNGFLGRHIAKQLFENGEEVIGVFHKRKTSIPDGVKPVSSAAIGSIRGPVKTVYYAAGNYDQPFPFMYQSQIIYLNEVSRTFPDSVLVYTSSTAVYGEYSGIIREDSVFNKPDAYGMAKLAGEYITSHHKQFRIVRLAALYGIGVKPDLFIAAIINDAKRKKTITLQGAGTRIRNFIHVRDAASLMICAGKYPKSSQFLGSGRWSYSLKRIATMVAGMVPGTRIVTSGSDTALPYKMDNTRTRRELGWEESMTLREGLLEMVNNQN